jgi:hypothetical protein
MALTKITSRILDSSGVTTVGTISTGVWQGTAINQTYLVGQSGTNTGDETLARINALDVTELGTISSGVWNGTVIASAYLDADTAHLSTTQTFTGAKNFSSNVGIGTSSPTYKLDVGGSSAVLRVKETNGTDVRVVSGGSIGYIGTYTNHELRLLTNGTEKLTISSTGAATFNSSSQTMISVVSSGVNVFQKLENSTQSAYFGLNSSGSFVVQTSGSSFSDKLTISSGGEAFISSTSGLTVGQSSASGTRTRLIYDGVYSYSTALYLNAVSSQPIYFKTSNTTKLTISSTGLATFTPSGEFAALFENTNTAGGQHCYVDIKSNGGSNGLAILRFKTDAAESGGTSAIIGSQDDLLFQTGTGDAYSTKMSILSGGVVNINTTGSGTQKLQVIGGIQNWYDTNFNRSTKVGYDGIYISGSQNGYLYSPQDWVFYAGGSEKMRLASGGQVAIGTGINTTKFRVLQSANGEWTAQFINTGTQPYGVSIDTSANSSNAYSFAIYTNSNTGLFVKNNARVGIGTTNPLTTLHVSGTIQADASATANNPLSVVSDTGGGLVTFQRSSAYTQMYMASTTSGNQFYVRSQGSGGVVLATGGTSWGNGSDARLKKNFETTQGLSEVLQIEPIKYHLKTQDNSETKKLGFKAQNLQTVIPEMILDMDEEDPEDGSKYLGIIPDYLFPVLVKAIQEQQTIIEDLKSRIETLEG